MAFNSFNLLSEILPPLSAKFKNGQDGDGITNEVTTRLYTYDDEGNTIYESYLREEDGMIQSSWSNSYEYDEQNRVVYKSSDENGDVINKINCEKEKNISIIDPLRNLQYENKKKVSELLNPLNFFFWLIVSFKDIF